MPRHINPKETKRTAMAPYNFVRLPNKIFTISGGIEIKGKTKEPWKHNDEFLDGTYSGYIDLELKTLTPLFIRGPVLIKDNENYNENWDQRDSRIRPEFYQTPQAQDGRPVIPASSLRGMIRNLVEVISFAKIQPVSNERPFFRTVSKDRIGCAYRDRLLQHGLKPRGGFIKITSNKKMIIPCEVLRIERGKIPEIVFNNLPSYTPSWNFQHKKCWVKREESKKTISKIIFGVKPNEYGWTEGVLVLTGNSPKKRKEFIFLPTECEPVIVPDNLWERFHDDDQITQWQQRAFPKNKPIKNCRGADGYLRNEEPVFFQTDESKRSSDNPDGLLFLGRAQMFRFPYDKTPQDLIPRGLKNAGLDLAEAMFGCVRKGQAAIKGRLFFEDAIAISGGPNWYEDVIVPNILSSPKVTTFQHYLTQDGTKGKNFLNTYLEGDHTTIRGHKFYWHRWDNKKKLDVVRETKDHDQIKQALLNGRENEYKSHTIIQPVKENVVFKGKIRFENLTDLELGALLSAIDLPEGCAHKLGMGKPLGLGSIKIERKLKLLDHSRRYRNWEDDGFSEHDGSKFISKFQKTMLQHAIESEEYLTKGKEGFHAIDRLNTLFLLLQWEKRPPINKTRYMVIENGDPGRFYLNKQGNEYSERPVLPSPNNVIDESKSSWPDDKQL